MPREDEHLLLPTSITAAPCKEPDIIARGGRAP